MRPVDDIRNILDDALPHISVAELIEGNAPYPVSLPSSSTEKVWGDCSIGSKLCVLVSIEEHLLVVVLIFERGQSLCYLKAEVRVGSPSLQIHFEQSSSAGKAFACSRMRREHELID